MNISKNIPGFLKTPLKFLSGSRARKRILIENGVRRLQNEAICRYNPGAQKLIVFLIPGPDQLTGEEKISGGMMSIVSICEESERMKDIHGADVIMCTLPNERLFFKHGLFINHTQVFRFNQLKKYFSEAKEIIFHLPEYTGSYFMEYLSNSDRKWLFRLKKLHINILNQNILLMPDESVMNQLKQLASVVTITTAHDRYCSRHFRDQYETPLHKFSVWISPEKYIFKQFSDKENLLIVSPDMKAGKQEILDKLSEIPGLKIQVIQNLTYEQYKDTISRAKWALTFGEGLDGYIIEPIFSGAIGFAVYNKNFFTPDFKDLETIYCSYDELLKMINEDIQRLDNKENFTVYQQRQFRHCARYYSHDRYQQNIRDFYKGEYSLP